MAKKAKAKKTKTSPKRKTKAKRKPSASIMRKRIIAAMLEQTEIENWRSVTLSTISESTGFSISEIYSVFPTKQAILQAYFDDVDQAVSSDTDPEDINETPRDRLFDVLMRRFDILQKHKPAIANILREMPNDPVSCLCSAPRFFKSMTAMLEAAQLSSPGIIGSLKTKGLSLVYLTTLRIWLKDDTPDMSKTMAALDKNLRRADQAASIIFKR